MDNINCVFFQIHKLNLGYGTRLRQMKIKETQKHPRSIEINVADFIFRIQAIIEEPLSNEMSDDFKKYK